jgi:hypothetical protein
LKISISFCRDYNDFKDAAKSGEDKDKSSAKTIDKHLFEIQGENYGSIDIKINSASNLLAVSSIDSEVTIYNIEHDRKLKLFKNLSDF